MVRYFVAAVLVLSLCSCSPQSPSRPVARSVQKDHLSLLRDDPAQPDELEPLQPLSRAEPDFDAIHYRLALDFPPESAVRPAFSGEVQITLKPVRENYRLLSLDSAAMKIRHVMLLDTLEELRFEQKGEKLEIDLAKPYGPGDTLTVSVSYDWIPNPMGAMAFVEGTIYSQGEAELSKYWFPGNSRPNDKATFEAYITVPKPLTALSNGTLVGVTDRGGSRTFHWSESIPLASYLYVVTIGDFAVQQSSWRSKPVQFYGPRDRASQTAYSLRHTADMLDFYSDLLGVEFPFEKYAQALVPQYQWGGMEHASATTLTDTTIHSESEDAEYSSDTLVAHELAHQWFGDLLTCRNWDDLWLNEGFAEYFQSLYDESRRGPVRLLEQMEDRKQGYLGEEALDPRPVSFGYFRDNLDDYYFDSHAYAKGAWILHMLKGRLGVQTFFKGIQSYLKSHAGQLVVSDDLKRSMEEASGQSLSVFFEQWVHSPGFPKFRVSWSYDDSAHQVIIQADQTQDTSLPGGIAGTTPVFTGPIRIEVDGVFHEAEIRSAHEQIVLPSAGPPRYVHFNAQGGWLAEVVDAQGAAALELQLSSSTDITARRDAAAGLAAGSEAALIRCAIQEFEDDWVREKCIENAALSRSDDAFRALSGLVRSGPSWRVRAAAAQSLGGFDAAKTLPVLRGVAESDLSVSVAKSAISAIRAPEAFDFLVAQLSRDSFRDLIREAALGALGGLGDPRAFEIGETYAGSGYSVSARVAAFGLLAAAGGEPARITIEGALSDQAQKVRVGALKALGQLKSPKSKPALERVAEEDPDISARRLARRLLKRL